eukprot:15253452-Alexandrium_andersonii.AAC.1
MAAVRQEVLDRSEVDYLRQSHTRHVSTTCGGAMDTSLRFATGFAPHPALALASNGPVNRCRSVYGHVTKSLTFGGSLRGRGAEHKDIQRTYTHEHTHTH